MIIDVFAETTLSAQNYRPSVVVECAEDVPGARLADEHVGVVERRLHLTMGQERRTCG
ncbi:hypothetical protein [Salinibacterium sp. ZJ454]|uniref:hypothetical protein n=1 Tax=Salinibacterium sp. ZJ454 TaxID=2708339 RepID=UPI001FBAD1A3|nr:hypothetical protein [Salinibacterium sp. ZJ454]